MNGPPSDAGATQDTSAAASRTLIPPPTRSRFAALPRLGMSSSSGESGSSSSVATTATGAPTKYTSVFQSPIKGSANPTAADTPSRLARFREANWVSKETKKRPRDADAESTIPVRNPRIVARLFADGASQEFAGLSQEEADRDLDVASAPSDSTSTADTTTARQLDPTHSEEEQRQSLDKETEIALGLHQELMRDNARLKLKTDSLREEIDFYFDTLTRIEQVVAGVCLAAERKRDTEKRDGGGEESVSKLASALQRIISAPKPTVPIVSSSLSGSDFADDPTLGST